MEQKYALHFQLSTQSQGVTPLLTFTGLEKLVFKKLVSHPAKCQMLESLGKNKELSDEDIECVNKFIQIVIYSGNEDEEYVATRIRLYQNLKVKSSMSIPPDPDSVVQVIKRAHRQSYEWIRCCHARIEILPLEGNGWIVDEEDNQVTVRPSGLQGVNYHHLLIRAKNSQKFR